MAEYQYKHSSREGTSVFEALTRSPQDSLRESPLDWITAISTSLAVIVALGVAVWNQRERNDDEMPIIALSSGHSQPTLVVSEKEGQKAWMAYDFWLTNLGKSIAKDINIYIEDILIEGNLPAIVPGSDQECRMRSEDAFGGLKDIFTSGRKKLSLRFTYRDVRERGYEVQTCFHLQRNSEDKRIYIADRGRWELTKKRKKVSIEKDVDVDND